MSYLAGLQLDCEPFSTSPDPEFFYRSIEHCTVLNRLEIAIRLRRGLSLVLGDVGTGKTTLLRALLQSFGEDEDYIFHIMLDPSFESEKEFLGHLTKIFGINVFFNSTVEYRNVIEKYLFQKCVEQNKTVVLLIDEGQKLAIEHLEILRTLLNYETNQQKLLQLAILAQMELLPRIKNMRNFMDRISFKAVLNPLNEYEIGKMIEFRLKQAGYQSGKSLFTYEAIKKVYEFTQGYPRQTALICHNAIEYLIMENHEFVTGEIMEKVISKERVWR